MKNLRTLALLLTLCLVLSTFAACGEPPVTTTGTETSDKAETTQPSESKPNGGEETTENGENKPNGGEETTENGENKPNGGEETTENGENKPNGGENKPNGGENKPNGGENKPNGGENKPNGGENKPDGGDETGDGENKPNGGENKPDDGDETTEYKTSETEPIVTTETETTETETTETEVLDCDHDLVSHDAKAPTCTEVGWDAYHTCSKCDYSTYEEKAAIGHNYVNYVCSKCGNTVVPSVGLDFTSNGDGTCYVSGIGTCEDSDIVIPLTSPEGYTVTSVYGFDGCDSLTSIVIPDSVTIIKGWAFSGCINLTRISIPSSVTVIEDNAFENCRNIEGVYITDIEAWCNIYFQSYYSNPMFYGTDLYLNGELLTEVVIPENVTRLNRYVFDGCSSITKIDIHEGVTFIGHEALRKCINLTNLIIPNSVTTIENVAFAECTKLNSITLPNDISTISPHAFFRCSNLENIIIPNSVTTIGSSAFAECTGLKSITISENITNIGESAFEGCTSLSNIIVDENNTVYRSEDGNLYNKDLTTLISYAPGKTETIFNIPNGVTRVESEAFCNCINLTNIIIPESVTSIGRGAFLYCINLTNITIPESVTNFSADFIGCINLTHITLNSHIEEIVPNMFRGCLSLKSILIPRNVRRIGRDAFIGCTSLISIHYMNTREVWEEFVYIDSSNSDELEPVNIVCSDDEWEYFKILPAVEPTCNENGLTEGKECTLCGLTLVEQEIIPATHSLEAYSYVANETSDEAMIGGRCTDCGEVVVKPASLFVSVETIYGDVDETSVVIFQAGSVVSPILSSEMIVFDKKHPSYPEKGYSPIRADSATDFGGIIGVSGWGLYLDSALTDGAAFKILDEEGNVLVNWTEIQPFYDSLNQARPDVDAIASQFYTDGAATAVGFTHIVDTDPYYDILSGKTVDIVFAFTTANGVDGDVYIPYITLQTVFPVKE